MNTLRSSRILWTLSLALILPAMTAQAEEAAGYCFEIIGPDGKSTATVELPRSESTTLRGELGAADSKVAAVSDGTLAEDSPMLILVIEAKEGTVKIGFPVANEEWKKKLAIMDLQVPQWGQLGDLDTPGKFEVGKPVGIMLEGKKLTIFPEDSDPLVALLK